MVKKVDSQSPQNNAMKNESSSHEKVGPVYTRSLKVILVVLLLPVIVAFLGPFYEHKIGVIVPLEQVQLEKYISILTPVIVLLIIIGGAVVLYSAIVSIWRKHYYRECFASIYTLGTLIWLFVVATCFATKTMPWAYVDYFLLILASKPVKGVSPTTYEYLLMLLVYLFYFYVAKNKFDSWDGQVSNQQYRAKLEGEERFIVADGLQELRRVVMNGPALSKPEYVEIRERLADVFDQQHSAPSLAWKDEARDLLRMASISYEFGRDAWHDSKHCWVGNNRETGKPVLLFPMEQTLEPKNLDAAVRYAEEIKNDRKSQIDALIVMVRNSIPKTIQERYLDRITFMSRREILESGINWLDYRNHIFSRVDDDSLIDSDLHIKDVYVSSRYHLNDQLELRNDIERYIDKWLEEKGRRQLAILGEYGHGKSTLALMLTYRLLKEHEKNPGARTRIPILIELRSRNPRNQSPLQLLGDWCAQYNMNPQALLRLHNLGRLLIIFEGFDEMSLVGDAQTRLDQFVTLWSFCTDSQNARIILTGRPNFFLDSQETQAALGTTKGKSGQPFCETIRLAPFSIDQIEKALDAYGTSIKQQICKIATKYNHFLEVISRPSILHIVAILWERERLFEKADKLDSAQVLELFVIHSYRRQVLKEHGQVSFMALSTAERSYFMQGVVAHMVIRNHGNQISSRELNRLIDMLTGSIPAHVSSVTDAIHGETRKPLRNRIEEADESVAIREQIRTDVRTCGLLVTPPGEAGKFQFGHKSFMEYLFASVAADYILNRSESSVSLLKCIDGQIGDIIHHPVSVRFLAELIGINRYCDRSKREQKIQAANLANAVIFSGKKTGSLSRFWFFLPKLFDECIAPIKRYSSVLHFLLYQSTFVAPLLVFPLIYAYIQPFSLAYTAIAVGSTSMLWAWFNAERRIFYRSGLHKKLGLWAYICRAVGIEESVLHEVAVPPAYFWIYKRSFGFCYSYVKSALETGISKNDMPDDSPTPIDGFS